LTDLKDGAAEEEEEEEEVMVLVDEVRALAALCIGPAVSSNLGEFRSWALTVLASVYQQRTIEVDVKEEDSEG
jgi:hypothetical protein